MKKIVLIGDSIRMNYDKFIKESLLGSAEVYYPKVNCRFTQNVLRMAHVWKQDEEMPDDVDLVHWNVGLWDCYELYGDGPLTSDSYYKEMIGRIDRRFRMLFPNAKMIFATTTAVLEDQYGKDRCRHNAVIERFNALAREALADTDTEINDLYAITKDCPRSCHSDAMHYSNDEGLALVGGRVLDVLCNALDIPKTEVDMSVFERENYTVKEIGN
ncbi:MAG: SGNH/GDSL hydrolase family protein [Clostridia bacterium]|nr:SGNH/GDSL hydrolase family protein [Clostridia bacterium]